MPPVGRSSVVSIRTVVVLPAPFGPEEGVDLALGDLEVDAVDGEHPVAEGALETLGPRSRPSRESSRSARRRPRGPHGTIVPKLWRVAHGCDDDHERRVDAKLAWWRPRVLACLVAVAVVHRDARAGATALKTKEIGKTAKTPKAELPDPEGQRLPAARRAARRSARSPASRSRPTARRACSKVPGRRHDRRLGRADVQAQQEGAEVLRQGPRQPGRQGKPIGAPGAPRARPTSSKYRLRAQSPSMSLNRELGQTPVLHAQQADPGEESWIVGAHDTDLGPELRPRPRRPRRQLAGQPHEEALRGREEPDRAQHGPTRTSGTTRGYSCTYQTGPDPLLGLLRARTDPGAAPSRRRPGFCSHCSSNSSAALPSGGWLSLPSCPRRSGRRRRSRLHRSRRRWSSPSVVVSPVVVVVDVVVARGSVRRSWRRRAGGRGRRRLRSRRRPAARARRRRARWLRRGASRPPRGARGHQLLARGSLAHAAVRAVADVEADQLVAAGAGAEVLRGAQQRRVRRGRAAASRVTGSISSPVSRST